MWSGGFTESEKKQSYRVCSDQMQKGHGQRVKNLSEKLDNPNMVLLAKLGQTGGPERV